jgi:lipoprotein-anchoring transpeptidase ErfK/SrfK
MRKIGPLRTSWVAAAVVATAVATGVPLASGLTSVAGAVTVTPVPTAAGNPLPAEPAETAEPVRDVAAPRPPRPAEQAAHLLVRVPRDLAARARPNAAAAVVGTVPSGSKYYDVPTTAWIEEVSPDGRWGRIEIPYVWPRRHGWIVLRGLARHTTNVQVRVDLSEHRITVEKAGRVLFGMSAATGAAGSPTPPGEYFVTDRIPFAGGSLGTFAFGISGIQPNLPTGWSGGNQLAIHGTNAPSSIGRSASAGCLRVSERSLDRLMPLLQLGTPVLVAP